MTVSDPGNPLRERRRVAIVPVLGSLMVLVFSARSAAPQEPPSQLTSEDSTAIDRAMLADPRVRAIVGAGRPRTILATPQLDKAEVEAFLADTSRPPPTARVTVVMSNVETHRAARAVVTVPQYRILAVQRLSPSDVPFVREDADQALALAKADRGVRSAIGDSLARFQILNSGDDADVPLAAQVLPLRSANRRDPCSEDRCLDLVFRTPKGYLPLRVRVDLTRRTVTVEREGLRR